MTIRRIVKHVHADTQDAAGAFYSGVLGMECLMDAGWISFYGAEGRGPIQVGIATGSGSPGMDRPDMTIETDDLDGLLARCKAAGAPVEYGPADEDWGVRRFFVRDPYGTLINIMTHTA